jgi:hypothetical protein
VIDDDTLPLGSPSNPIVICDEEGGHKTEQTGSDADTELMLTPEFWDSVMNFDPPHGATVVDLTQDSLSVGSSGSQNTAQAQLLCDMPATCNQMSDDSSRAIEADERSVGSSGSYDTAQPQLLCASPTNNQTDDDSPRAAEAAECKSRRKGGLASPFLHYLTKPRQKSLAIRVLGLGQQMRYPRCLLPVSRLP